MIEGAEVSPEMFSAEWWNGKLKTTHGEEIVLLLKKHEYPLVLQPAIPGLDFVVTHIFRQLGAGVERVISIEDAALLRASLRPKMVSQSFHDVVNEFKKRCLSAEDLPTLQLVHETFWGYLQALDEKWREKNDLREETFSERTGARLTFQFMLSDMVFFTALGKRDVVTAYLCCLELFQKGNYILGCREGDPNLPGGSALVVVAPDCKIN